MRLRKSLEKSASGGNLVGHFFHSLTPEKKIHWQGTILSEPRKGWYLVQLFEWFAGEPSTRHLVPFKQMSDWLFYETVEEMQFSYKHGVARLGGPYRPEATRPDEALALNERSL